MSSESVLAFEAIEPGWLGRCSWESVQAQRDAELLAWVGRFRFVTAEAIATRFEVSCQAANSRVRRLERVGLLGTERAHVSQARAVFLTARGHTLLGWPRRRPPRAELQREHEEAIVQLVTELERENADARVLTERECRTLHDPGQGRRYAVELRSHGGGKRWPDAVLESDDGRRAFEIEFAPKGTDRLRAIITGYELGHYDEVTFLVKSASLGRRIAKLHRPLPNFPGQMPRAVRVEPWLGLPSEQRHSLANALAS